MNRKVIVVFDLDETLTQKDTYIPYLLLALKCHPGKLPASLLLPFITVPYLLGIRNNTWLKEQFLRMVLKGRTTKEIHRINELFVSRLLKNGMDTQILHILKNHQAQGHWLVMLSASLDCYVADVGAALGFNETIATEVGIRDGRLTGNLAGPNLKGVEKLRALENHLGAKRKHCEIIAYADHPSDQDLLAWADQGFWVRHTPELDCLAAKLNIAFV
ncbi:MAG: hypothetical protein DSY80_07205 [Desulfocapsa sp.]|nr:MAG: hypothetical protein DSY80_07205 [Desulfocapsa sp.]